MATWHGYFGIENLNLNASQKATLVSALRQLGPGSDSQPANLNHWRTRLDGDAAIYEALFDENHLTIQAFKNRLASIFGIDVSTITHTATTQSYGGGMTNIVTFRRNSTSYLRVALFGGIGAAWEQSRLECLGYLAANLTAWELAA